MTSWNVSVACIQLAGRWTRFICARREGFDNISLDLMMWLPQQTLAHWLESVDQLIALGPDHASMYLLELYPNAPLRDAMARGQWSLAPEDDAAEMYVSGPRAGWTPQAMCSMKYPMWRVPAAIRGTI